MWAQVLNIITLLFDEGREREREREREALGNVNMNIIDT
jgi:hypothetical protein